MNDADAMGFRQSCADLPRDADGLTDRQSADPVDEALKVLAGDVFHGDVIRAFLPAEVVHPADIPVGDGPRQFQFVSKALDRLLVGGDLGIEELEGELFADLRVENLVNPAHPAVAEVLNDLVPPGKGRACGQFVDGHLKGFGSLRADVL